MVLQVEASLHPKHNNGFPGTMLMSPRPGRTIVEGIQNRDDRWREKFFVFKVNQAYVEDFDFEKIPREWSEDIDKIIFRQLFLFVLLVTSLIIVSVTLQIFSEVLQ